MQMELIKDQVQWWALVLLVAVLNLQLLLSHCQLVYKISNFINDIIKGGSYQ
jgi:hypothetical protein